MSFKLFKKHSVEIPIENVNIPKLEIYIYSHKNFMCPVHNEQYTILNEQSLYPNINQFGKAYNEIKGFWYVNNLENLKEYVGFCSYRRYFKFLDNIPDIDQLFTKYDIIVPKNIDNISNILKESVYEHYAKCHNKRDLDFCLEYISNNYPEYKDDIQNIIINGKKLYTNGIFIMRSFDFKKYCEWLFDILSVFNKFYNLHNEADYYRHIKNNYVFYHNTDINQAVRVIGYLQERLFTLYVIHNFKNILELETVLIQ